MAWKHLIEDLKSFDLLGMLMRYLLLLTLLTGCSERSRLEKQIIEPVLQTYSTDAIQQERDEIFSLLTYSLVFRDWQPHDVRREKRRGYNIGALLVSPDHRPEFYGLNCINSTNNATQHGEVRSIIAYLEKTRRFDLRDFTIYTSLEPCVMCAGMITMTSICRAVYGQHDVEYSRAFERLAVDTRPIGGFPPYPRKVIAQASTSNFCRELDDAYAAFLKRDSEKILAKFLSMDEARLIYERAYNTFMTYKVRHPENQVVFENAISFFHRQNN